MIQHFETQIYDDLFYRMIKDSRFSSKPEAEIFILYKKIRLYFRVGMSDDRQITKIVGAQNQAKL